MRLKTKMETRTFVLAFLLLGGATSLSFAQRESPDAADFAGAYADLHPEQKRLVDDWFGRFSRAIAKPVSPEEGYDKLPLSVKTTFSAVTHALLHTKLTDSSGGVLRDSVIALVDKVDNVAGRIDDAGGDRQFRIFVQLVPGTLDVLSKSQEFARKGDNTVYHKGYPINFRARGGIPSIQISVSLDQLLADIDVDYRSGRFPSALFNGHLSAANSDVRAGSNDQIHNNRWTGLQNWWRNLLGLPYLERHAPTEDVRVIPLNPRVRDEAKPEEAVFDFLNSWLVADETTQAVAYFSERAYSCVELERGRRVDRGMVKYGIFAKMQDISQRLGKGASLADFSVGVQLTGERLRVVEQPHHSQFVLYDVREDLAQEIMCENKVESAAPPARASGSRSFGKYAGAVFRLGRGDLTGETVATLWGQERGYWKLISYDIEPEFQPDRVPTAVSGPPTPDTPSLMYVAGDEAMTRAASDFLQQWLIRRNMGKALAYLSASCNSCVNLYLAEGAPEPSTPNEARDLLRKGMSQAAEVVKPAKTLDDAIAPAEPHHQDLMLVKHTREAAFAIVSVPDYMATTVDCTKRQRGEDPDFHPIAAGGNHGNYYAAGFSLKHTVGGNPAILWTVWGKEDAAWKIISYLIVTP